MLVKAGVRDISRCPSEAPPIPASSAEQSETDPIG